MNFKEFRNLKVKDKVYIKNYLSEGFNLQTNKAYEVISIDFTLDKLAIKNDNGDFKWVSYIYVDLEQKENKTEATKHDSGKAEFSSVPQAALLEVAKVFTHGKNKYGRFNYSKGMEYLRYCDAAQRHLNEWLRGKDDDDDSKCNHLSAACANLMMLLDNQLTKKGIDNRNKVYND